MSTSKGVLLVSILLASACAAPAADDSAAPADRSDDVVEQAATREIFCSADAIQKRADFHFRLSTDGKVEEGTVLRGFEQDSPDARVTVESVAKEGDRIRVKASEGDLHYDFTVSAAGFAAKTRAELDAKIVETNDHAILDARPSSSFAFQCKLSDSAGGLVMMRDDAKRLFDAMKVAPLTSNVGEHVKVISAKGPFRLYCSTTGGGRGYLCTITLPALVTSAAGGRVAYGYDLSPDESKALSTGLGVPFTGTDFEDSWSGAKADAKMALSCNGASCRAEYTVPDAFYANVR